jgi:hypothetical protein
MNEANGDYNGEWAIVELFGHTTLVGRIAEVERFGTKMLAIEPLFNGLLLPTVFHGGASIYRLTPCSEQIARERQPKQTYQLPPTIAAILPLTALPAADGPDDPENDEPEDSDDDEYERIPF